MKFSKEVKFLSMTSNVLSDGGVYYTISLFNDEVGAFAVNVMDNRNNGDMLSLLSGCTFGTDLEVVFMLRPKDKLYRLALFDVQHA